MTLKSDCVRDTMLYLEKNLELNDCIQARHISIKKYKSDDIVYTISKLIEGNYINARDCSYDDVMDFYISSITWDGHKFLDTIRDNKVWSTTKGIVSKFSSVSISMIENISSQVISNLITQYMVHKT